MPAECLRVFAQSVYESEVSEEDVERMIKTNPQNLLELPPPPPLPAATNGSGDGRASALASSAAD